MEHYASEQEQVEQLKRWWKENGRSLVFGLVIGIGGLAGYRYWDASETARAENASLTYEQFLTMAGEQRREDAVQTGNAILENYPGSAYARMTTLMLAKIAVEGGDYERAEALLETLISEDPDAEIAQIARARLARIRLAGGDAAAAAALLDAIPALGEQQRFSELRADVAAARGEIDAARALYLEALAHAEELGLERGAIQLKLDNLGAAAAAGGS